MKKTGQICRDALEALLQSKVEDVANDPAFYWGGGFKGFMVDDKGKPVVRGAIVTFSPDVDMWEGLRHPSGVGLYPLTPADIWRHGAVANVECMKPDGSPNPLAMPEPYEEALSRINRVVVISTMLMVNPEIFSTYAQKMDEGDEAPYDHYQKVTDRLWDLNDRATSNAALSLYSRGQVVVPMTRKVTSAVTKGTRGAYYTGRFNGPCNGFWPQHSVAALTGVARFGVNRLAFRDEVTEDGERLRLYGRFGSIVLFDEHEPVDDPEKGIKKLDSERLASIRTINDYRNCDEEALSGRYCTYNLRKKDGTSVCGRCIDACPTGALPNSSVLPDGTYREEHLKKQHRFSEGVLDFDAVPCSRYHHQRTEVWEDFTCGRCEVICAARGVRKSAKELGRINSN
ncbi:hypothetical protein ACFL1X_02270 [Candidatus Hydrogenedentota bacterium]